MFVFRSQFFFDQFFDRFVGIAAQIAHCNFGVLAFGANQLGHFAAALFALTALAQTFQVVSGEARYRVREELLQVGLTDAVGTTKAVRGEVRLQDGRVSGEFVVDLRELKSDQARRDNYLRQRTLETDRYPFATFRPKEVRGLPNPLPRQGKVPIQVVGDLTIKETTAEVVWEGEAEFQGDEVRVFLRTEFPFEKFGLAQPRVSVVLSLENRIRLEVELVLRRQ